MDLNLNSGQQTTIPESSLIEKEETSDRREPSPLSEHHREVSRSLNLSSNVKAVNPVEVIADGPIKSNSLPKRKKRSRPSFKSVINLMSRFKNSSSVEKSSVESGGPKGGWTPSLPRKNGQSNGKQTNDSSLRPLMTRTCNSVWNIVPGTVGIPNHGNTCFMNAVIQCLSNTDWFSKYFITKQYKDDMKTKSFSKKFSIQRSDVPEQLGKLLESLWSNGVNVVAEVSSGFKSVVGKNNSQYKGSEQHDAQEFFLWLLDRLNEDIFTSYKKKEKTKRLSTSEISDETAAKEVLQQNSGCVLYNLFQALYRSSLQCPKCQKLSNTFESYLCLSLPLPARTTRPVFVIYVSRDVEPMQIKFGLMLNVHDTVRELREATAVFMNISSSRIVLCQIFEDGISTRYCDDLPLTDISEVDPIYAIETLPPPNQGGNAEEFESSYTQLIVVNTERRSSPTRYLKFCAPVILCVPRDINYRNLQRKILTVMGECVKEGLLTQKLDALFRLRLLDEFSGKRYYLQDDQEIMPLYTQAVDSALNYGAEYGPQHIELVAEWEPAIKERVIIKDNNVIHDDISVKKVRMTHQQPLKVSLEDCFQLFTRDEKLSGEDAWECSHCHRQQRGATKTIGLWSLPDVMVIHLKRFRQVGLRRSKLSTLVDFPVRELDMSPHVVRRAHCEGGGTQMVYELNGVLNHYGTMQGGHYTAFCKNPVDDRWYEYDDSKVKPMAEAEVKTSSAYLLFYQRRGVMDTVREDLESGFHWIYKLYPNAYKSVSKNLNKNANNSQPRYSQQPENIMDEGIPQHLNSPEHSPLVSVYNSPKRVHNTPPNMQDSPLRKSDSEPSVYRADVMHAKTNSDVVVSETVSDQAWRHVDMESDDVVRPSQLKNPQKTPGHTQREVNVTVNNRKLYDHTKYTEKSREHHSPVKQSMQPKNENSEKKYSTGSGLSVKMPEKEVFVVRQNHKTGQTTVESLSKHIENRSQLETYAKQNSTSGPQNNGSYPSKVDPQGKRFSAPHTRNTNDHRDEIDVPIKPKSYPPSLPSRLMFTQDSMSRPHDNTVSSQDQPHSLIDFSRQLSHPTKGGYIEREETRNPAVKRSKSQTRTREQEQNTINERMNQAHDQRNGFSTNNKFATIARVNQRVQGGEHRDSGVVRSSTEGSLGNSSMIPGHKLKDRHEYMDSPLRGEILDMRDALQNSPHLHQAGSRKPVYNGVLHTDSHSYTEGFPRYQPQKHYRKTPNKEELDNLNKEKLYSPCLKESSV